LAAGGRTTRKRLTAVLRFVGAVLAMSGALLLADVGVTLVWQEPISAFLATRSQDSLERQLSEESRRFASSADGSPDVGSSARSRLARAARAFAARLRRGRAFGEIAMPTLGQSYVVAEGTDAATLRKGPGHYPGTGLPGLRRTVAVAGHRTTYLAPFGDIDELRRGQPIVLTMPYGRFTYSVEETRTVDPSALWVTRSGHDRLVLTSCHPPLSAAQRIVVFARLTRSESRPAADGSSS
jgi:sortase A